MTAPRANPRLIDQEGPVDPLLAAPRRRDRDEELMGLDLQGTRQALHGHEIHPASLARLKGADGGLTYAREVGQGGLAQPRGDAKVSETNG